MRIIAGQHRGLHLVDVGAGDMAAHLRPTSDRVRESIFNLLIGGYGDVFNGARVLDLFAGTGALGIEALSRGAAHATFVDDGAVAQGLIARNIALLKRPAADTRVLKVSATALPPNVAPAYDVAFMDPPYGKSMGVAALRAMAQGGWLRPGAIVVAEDKVPTPPQPGFKRLDLRRYGDTQITLFEFTGPR